VSEERTRRLFDVVREAPIQPDPNFIAQLRREVRDVATADFPTPINTIDNTMEEPIMITLENETSTDTHGGARRPPMRLTIAAAALLIAGIGVTALFAIQRDDPSTPTADEPAPVDSEQQADATLLTAERFMTAYDLADRTSAMSFVSEDAPMQIGGQFIARSEIGPLFRLSEVVDDRYKLQRCELVQPNQVTCVALYSNGWSDAVGAEPVDATFFLRIEGDQITALRAAIDTATFGPTVWDRYLEFVREQSLDDFGKMFASNADGMGIIGPALTDESVELHATYTRDFAASSTSG
jgi:hypothetical protein